MQCVIEHVGWEICGVMSPSEDLSLTWAACGLTSSNRHLKLNYPHHLALPWFSAAVSQREQAAVCGPAQAMGRAPCMLH